MRKIAANTDELTPRVKRILRDGASSKPGHDSRTIRAVKNPRKASTASASRTNVAHESWYTLNHRKS
jgi:hypothetical protein